MNIGFLRVAGRARARAEQVAARRPLQARSMQFPPIAADVHLSIRAHVDYTRLATLAAALHRLDKEQVEGSLAEVGVYRGDTSVLLNRVSPGRLLHLFDTFHGFPPEDLEQSSSPGAGRFRETSAPFVRDRLPRDALVQLHPGRVPSTFGAISDDRFAFVLIDLDLYAPTVAALEFFYPRLTRGAFLFLHDYNSPESDWACMRAMDAFMVDKPEHLVDICDRYGSALLRKQ